ncbi:MAG TPA: hypothetical protein VHA15_16875 [Burkholderiales bacterium]|jgi:hypothetical protein|nr:hypothetical protein [Burkholderiales bacterium]
MRCCANTLSRRLCRLVAGALLGGAALPAATAQETLSFDSPRVLDLSGALAQGAKRKLVNRPVDIDSATPQTGSVAAIFDRPEVRRGDADVLAVVAGKAGEVRRIQARRGAVTRKGPLLVLESRVGEPFRFRDWAQAATKDAEGDEQTFLYAGTLRGAAYHKVDVHFGHDSPGTFLVHPRSGKLLFVHAEDDFAALSGERNRLFVMSSGLNPPFGFLVAALRKDGPAVALHCLAEKEGRVMPSFRGWHAAPAVGFDLVLVVRQAGDVEAYEALPVRFLYLNNEWRALAPDAERLLQATGLSCRQ